MASSMSLESKVVSCKRIIRLSSAATKIGDVVEPIMAVAEQANLLALHVTIAVAVEEQGVAISSQALAKAIVSSLKSSTSSPLCGRLKQSIGTERESRTCAINSEPSQLRLLCKLVIYIDNVSAGGREGRICEQAVGAPGRNRTSTPCGTRF